MIATSFLAYYCSPYPVIIYELGTGGCIQKVSASKGYIPKASFNNSNITNIIAMKIDQLNNYYSTQQKLRAIHALLITRFTTRVLLVASLIDGTFYRCFVYDRSPIKDA